MAPSDDNTGGNGAEPPVASPRKSPLGGLNFKMPKGLNPTVAVVVAALLGLSFGGGYVAATTGVFTGGKGGPEGGDAGRLGTHRRRNDARRGPLRQHRHRFRRQLQQRVVRVDVRTVDWLTEIALGVSGAAQRPVDDRAFGHRAAEHLRAAEHGERGEPTAEPPAAYGHAGEVLAAARAL